MKIKKIINYGMFLLIGIFIVSLVSAEYSRSNPNYGAFDSFVQEGSSFDYDRCEAGQDFILQIAPFGCEPAVVRSDLLEEQNVPVFCQIAATKINPLIDVEAIESISFSGQYPKEVSGIGFHPAKAALGVRGDLNSPLLENIGYAVIVLKKQEKESEMPDFVQGNLTAKIKYDIKNAFGIGKASFYLPEFESDNEWEEKKNQYSFWDGRGYLKAESIDTDRATISIYDDIRKISSISLNKGETSQKIYIPGFDCLAGLELKLDGLENPDTRAKLDINGEIVEVADNERFLDNKCRITNINKKGIVQEVEIRCDTDEKSGEKINLKISPKIKLNFTGAKEEGYEVGDILYRDEVDSKRNVFLGYAGRNKDGKLFIILAMTTAKDKDEFLNSIDISLIEEIAKIEEDYWGRGGVNFVSALKETVNIYGSVVNAIVRGSDYSFPIYEGSDDLVEFKFGETMRPFLEAKKFWTFQKDWTTPTYTKKNIKFIGLAGGNDKEIEEDVKENYKNAIADYDKIINNYRGEKYGNITYDEEALYQKILLAWNSDQKKTMLEWCKEFERDYPDSKKRLEKYCEDEVKLANFEISSRDVVINNRVKRISFEQIVEPSFDDYGAKVSVSGTENGKFDGSYDLIKGKIIKLSDKEFFELKEINDDYIMIHAEVKPEGVIANWVAQQKDFKILLNKYELVGDNRYQIRLNKINLKKSAKVSVIPNIDNAGTEASFPFKVGIEKRAIQLSPEKTKERIENLEKTIAEWQDKSDKLGNVVKGLKGACLATGAYLTVKNFLSNTGGKSIARQNVMRGAGGWNEKCTNAVSGSGELASKGYKTLNECFTKESDNINKDVDKVYNALSNQNEEIKKLQEGCEQEDSGILSLFGTTHINTDCLKEKLAPEVTKELNDNIGNNIIDVGGGEKKDASEIIKMINENTTSVEQLKRIQLNSRVDSNMAKAQLQKDLKDIYVNNKEIVERTNFEKDSGKMVNNPNADNYGTKDSIQGIYRGSTASSSNFELNEGTPVQLITFNNKKYYLELEESGKNNYHIKNVYDSDWTLLSDVKGDTEGVYDSKVAEIKSTLGKGFKKYDKSSYENTFKSVAGETGVVAKFYETEPYKGYPALVPFDLKNGWYAATRQTLPVLGNIKPYDESGRVTSLWLCNVGKNGIAEFKSEIGDDECEMINLGTGQAYNQFPGLDKSETSKLVGCAVEAIRDASNYKSGSNEVSIGTVCDGTHSIKVGKPAVDIPEMQCQDFMSPKECQLLFNVCDPVICPSSRCNLGGAYHVRDVIQSGIIGSIALCLPNFREGIYIPVCLTGIQAGIDGYLSVLKSHRDCLQDSLEEGKMVGICDEIYSIHLCEFFWRQGLPVAKLILPKMIEWAMGQNVRGGGEYLGVASAWQNAEKSISYFTQYYAANSFEAFKARTAEDVGGEVCKSFVSGVYPEGGNLLDSLTEPDSPPQYHGRFDEIPFTTATVPPVSHYKVFYHIYAGKDSRAYYQVYLKAGPESTFYQDTSYRRIVDSGYIARGEYVSETKDFTAPAGYKEMCIRVNEQEECGFKQVSTSYAVNYVEDQYLKDQASQTDIKSETDCISGTASAYSLLSPNIQEGVDEVINPAIYERGIIRICATDNPGKGTDGTGTGETARWVEVGYCDNQKIKCWLDKVSVKNVIEDLNLENATLQKLTENQLDILKKEGNYLSDEEYKSKIEEKEKLVDEKKYQGVIDLVIENLDRVFWNYQKTKLLLNRAQAYGKLVRVEKMIEEQKKAGESVACDMICGMGYTSAEKMSEGDCNKISESDFLEGCCCYDEEDDYLEKVELCYENCKVLDEVGNYESDLIKEKSCEEDYKGIYSSLDTKAGDTFNCCCYKGGIDVEEEYCEAYQCTASTSLSSGKVIGGDCQIKLGEKIIEIAKSKKNSEDKFKDNVVFENTGAKNFECLVLQLAMQESCLAHCMYKEEETNYQYCDGDSDFVVKGDEGSSIGVMQLNKDVHGEKYGVEENIDYAVDFFISRYNSGSRTYSCTSTNYAGWQRALRYYNGWPSSGCSGDPNYVEHVLSKKEQIANLFPECRN